MGNIEAIWIKRSHGGVMDRVVEAELIAGRGIRGNADQGGRRQITIISEEAWRDAIAELGADVDPSARRANVLVSGLELARTRGLHLRLGSCLVKIWSETTPCYQMDEARQGLKAALKPKWRAGVSCEIVEGGSIHVGDAVNWSA